MNTKKDIKIESPAEVDIDKFISLLHPKMLVKLINTNIKNIDNKNKKEIIKEFKNILESIALSIIPKKFKNNNNKSLDKIILNINNDGDNEKNENNKLKEIINYFELDYDEEDNEYNLKVLKDELLLKAFNKLLNTYKKSILRDICINIKVENYSSRKKNKLKDMIMCKVFNLDPAVD
jgi:hypothetical protein